jgi:hypothetical protein
VWCASRDGSLVVRGASDAAVRAPPLPTGNVILSLLSVPALGGGRAGARVWAGTESGAILLFGAESVAVEAEARTHSGGVTCLALAGGGGGGGGGGTSSAAASEAPASRGRVWSGSEDFTIVLWSGAGEFLRLLTGHAGGVKFVLPLGPSLWSGGDDASVRVWSTLAGVARPAVGAAAATAAAAASAPAPGAAAPRGGGRDDAGAGVVVLSGHTDAVLGAVVLQGGELVWSCSADGTVSAGGDRLTSRVTRTCNSLSLTAPRAAARVAPTAAGVDRALPTRLRAARARRPPRERHRRCRRPRVDVRAGGRRPRVGRGDDAARRGARGSCGGGGLCVCLT